MTDVITPVPADTPIGDLIGGKLYGRNLLGSTDGTLIDPATSEGQASALTALQALLPAIVAITTALGGTLHEDGAVTVGGVSTAARQDAAALIGTETYVLADGSAGLAPGASTAPVTVARGGYYFFDASFAGASPSLKLQRLGADGTTWIDVVTRAAVGSGDPVGIPSQSSLRLTNAGANALTAVAGRLG